MKHKEKDHRYTIKHCNLHGAPVTVNAGEMAVAMESAFEAIKANAHACQEIAITTRAAVKAIEDFGGAISVGPDTMIRVGPQYVDGVEVEAEVKDDQDAPFT